MQYSFKQVYKSWQGRHYRCGKYNNKPNSSEISPRLMWVILLSSTSIITKTSNRTTIMFFRNALENHEVRVEVLLKTRQGKNTTYNSDEFFKTFSTLATSWGFRPVCLSPLSDRKSLSDETVQPRKSSFWRTSSAYKKKKNDLYLAVPKLKRQSYKTI